MMMSCPAARAVTASNMSWADTTSTVSTQTGFLRPVGPDTSVTSAPRAAAARAMA